MPVSAFPSQEIVTGSGILDQYALWQQILNGMQNDTAGVTGYYNGQPTLARELGFGQLGIQQGQLGLGRDELQLNRELGFGQLGLGRDQLNAAIAEARRNYELDKQRFGLDVANFNYNQRLGEATTRLAQLDLLSGLRGPKDYLAYNYTINNMAAPPGQAVDPFQLTAGMNQQYTPPPLPNIADPAPTTMYQGNMAAPAPSAGAPSTPRGGAVTAAPPAPVSKPKAQPPIGPQGPGLAITGNQAHDQALAASPAWSGASPEIMAEYNRISQNMNNTYNNAVAQNPNFQLFAEGGVHPGGVAVINDTKSGKPSGYEEAVVSEHPFTVLDHEDTMDMVNGAFGGGDEPWWKAIPHAAQGGQFGGWGQNAWWQQYAQQNPQQFGAQLMARLQQLGPGIQQRVQQNVQQRLQQSLPGGMPQGWQQGWGQGMPQGMPQGNPFSQWQQYIPQQVQQYLPQWMQGGQGGPQGGPSTTPTEPIPPMSQQGQNVQQNNQQSQQNQVFRAATGGAFTGTNPGQGFFNANVYGPEATQNAPFVQQTLGNQQSPPFQQRGQSLGPFGAQPFSYTNYLSLLPSAREMLRGYVETPEAMGGLGSDWMDELERSRRAAATGVTLGPTGYGR